MLSLDGKVALVTGGARGIGAAIAIRLAREGADVVLTYSVSRQQAEAVVAEITALGRRGLAIQADSADALAVTDAVHTAAALFGGLDILVNNAGRYVEGPIETYAAETIDAAFALNVRSVFVTTAAALKYLPRGGRIVTIGSVTAERASMPGQILYASTKSALLGLNRGLARELGPRGITTVVVQPGPTATDTNPENDGARSDRLRAIAPIGKFAQPEHIADVVAFLTGPDGEFITGTAITVDGGVNA
ncbi:SDR family NAD(P)-dependent oxidoreductase [Nocardia sp. NPDC052566]|uniref:SDR family NAD(P)-dependent oxidoreductase n=1 Tax=Nocardia sp. NPDC052566 TaxID=3364330 RepID=UPI0037C9DB57